MGPGNRHGHGQSQAVTLQPSVKWAAGHTVPYTGTGDRTNDDCHHQLLEELLELNHGLLLSPWAEFELLFRVVLHGLDVPLTEHEHMLHCVLLVLVTLLAYGAIAILLEAANAVQEVAVGVLVHAVAHIGHWSIPLLDYGSIVLWI